jgi:hypothetical protein
MDFKLASSDVGQQDEQGQYSTDEDESKKQSRKKTKYTNLKCKTCSADVCLYCLTCNVGLCRGCFLKSSEWWDELPTCSHFNTTEKIFCGARDLREDEALHGSVCPVAPVDCPFEPHGCDINLQRRSYAAHQVEAAVQHAELMSAKLTQQANALTELSKFDGRADGSVQSRTVSWKIPNFAQVRENQFSEDVVVGPLPGVGVYRMYLKLNIKEGYVGLFWNHHKCAGSSNQSFPLKVAGSEIALVHPVTRRMLKREPFVPVTPSMCQAMVGAGPNSALCPRRSGVSVSKGLFWSLPRSKSL